MSDPIFEAAAAELEEWDSYQHEMMARAVLRVVTPLIEAAALERAAKVAEDYDVKRMDGYIARDNVAVAIAAAVRALIPAKDQS